MGEVEKDPTYTDKQRQLYKDRLDDLNTEKQARLKILSQNRKYLQTQVAWIKQTLEKVLDKDTPLPEKVRFLIREQVITITSTLTAFLAGIATIILSVIVDFGGVGGAKGPPSKDKGCLDRIADAFKSLTGKTVDALVAIVGSAFGTILSFLEKAAGFVAEHTWALIVSVAGLVSWWLIQKIKKD